MKRVILFLLCLAALAMGMRSEGAEPCYPPLAVNAEVTKFPSNDLLWLIVPGANQHATWWCDLGYKWHFVAISGYRKNLVGDWAEKLARFNEPQATQADKALIVDSFLKGPIDSTYPELKPFQEVIKTSTQPPDIRWAVKSFSRLRPYYEVYVSSGQNARRTTVAGYVKPGQPCRCWRIAFQEGDSHMCDVGEALSETTQKPIGDYYVALCARQ